MPQCYNWPFLVKEIQDTLFMTQGELAIELGMSQGQISAIMIGTRNPGIKIEKYLISPPSLDKLEKFLKGPEGGGIYNNN